MKTGHTLTLKIRSFGEKRNILQAAIRAGVARCDRCDNPAIRVFWQDQEEWYLECAEHYTEGEQWTGSTVGRYPRVLSVPVFSEDAALGWMKTEPFGKGRKFKVEAYDRTNYYALLHPDMRKAEYLIGKATEDVGWRVFIYPLIDDRFAYQLEYRVYSPTGSGFCHTYALTGGFASEREALNAAMQDRDMPYEFRPKPQGG